MSFRNSGIAQIWSNEVIFQYSISKFRNWGISEWGFWDFDIIIGNIGISEFSDIPIFRYTGIPEFQNIGISEFSGSLESRYIRIFWYSNFPIFQFCLITEYWNIGTRQLTSDFFCSKPPLTNNPFFVKNQITSISNSCKKKIKNT